MKIIKSLVVMWIVVLGLSSSAIWISQTMPLHQNDVDFPIPSETEILQAVVEFEIMLVAAAAQALIEYSNMILQAAGSVGIMFIPFVADYPGTGADLLDDSFLISLMSEDMGYYVIYLHDYECTLFNYVVMQIVSILLGDTLRKPVVQFMQMHGNPVLIGPFDSYTGQFWNPLLAFNYLEMQLILNVLINFRPLIGLLFRTPNYVLIADCCSFMGGGIFPLGIGHNYVPLGMSAIICGWFDLGVCGYMFNAFSAMLPDDWGGENKAVGNAWVDTQPNPNPFGGVPVIFASLMNPWTYHIPVLPMEPPGDGGDDPPPDGGDDPPPGGGEDPPGGGGCPILYVYNEDQFISEGLLDIHASEDVILSHQVETAPQRVNNRYLFKLVEHPQTISHIDRVRLIVILDDGTVKNLPLLAAFHSEKGSVKRKLRFSDDIRIDTVGANHNNGTSQEIILKFLAPRRYEIAQIFFVIEGHNAIAKS